MLTDAASAYIQSGMVPGVPTGINDVLTRIPYQTGTEFQVLKAIKADPHKFLKSGKFFKYEAQRCFDSRQFVCIYKVNTIPVDFWIVVKQDLFGVSAKVKTRAQIIKEEGPESRLTPVPIPEGALLQRFADALDRRFADALVQVLVTDSPLDRVF